ncbi:MAG: O-acetyl-ADP-ribose deacetylase [Deltaproteobacteria bacterium]|nr:O-acetyl-ADP-ribose deacetylase [Deltaproteobacteria bacterium]
MKTYPISDRTELVLALGDITQLAVDAIVNAANERMLGGGGVDGAIHRAAGPALRAACEQVSETSPGVRCPTGEARITAGFDLPAQWVIHTVGPVYQGPQSAPLLADAYRSSLVLAREHDLASVAFPAISCGVYGYPLEAAATIALQTCREHAGGLRHIQFALFGDDTWQAFLAAASALFAP